VLVAMGAVPATAAARRHHRHHRRAQRASTCANANAGVQWASTTTLRAAVVCLINQQRAAHGLPGLHASVALNRSAQGWTDTMVNRDLFGHGADFSARISAAGMNWSSAGENIATGYSTPGDVVNGWMASTGHCENILNPTFRDAGTGVSAGSLHAYGTSEGTWTVDFALPMGQRALSRNYGPASGCPY
jgi:uncharacterized protein YkwD